MAESNFSIRVARSNIPMAVQQVRRRVGLVLKKVAADIEADAKTRAAYRTGHLRGSIRGHQVNQHEAHIDVRADYAAYVEFGTRKMGPRPFLGPAVDAARPEFEQAIGQAVEQGLREAEVNE